MQDIRNTHIHGRASGQNFCDFSISDCVFDGCCIPRQLQPGCWTIIRNVVIQDITNVNCSVNTALIDEVALYNLKRHGDSPLFLWGCVFRHVKLSGKISGIKINRPVTVGTDAARVDQEAWDTHVKKFYESADWALDISEAKFGGGISFEAVPGDKIRRNPETQVLVRRNTLLPSHWKTLDYGNSAFNIGLSWFLDGSLFDSVVLAARMASKEFKRDLAVLAMLRNEGIAE